MTRDISAPNQAAAEARVVRVVRLAELHFLSGTLYLSDLEYDITVASQVYTGLKDVGGISEVQETGELQVDKVTLTLNGVPREMIARALADTYQGRPGVLLLLFLDEQHQQVDTPMIWFDGRMDVMRSLVDKGAALELDLLGRLSDIERPKPRWYNNTDQQSRFPDDKGLEFVPQMVEKEIIWPDENFFRRDQ